MVRTVLRTIAATCVAMTLMTPLKDAISTHLGTTEPAVVSPADVIWLRMFGGGDRSTQR